MATRAFFIISVAAKMAQTNYQDILKDLETIPEVRSVDRVRGACDLLVEVEAPIRMIFVANKLMAKDWVKRLYVLKVEPFGTEEYQGLTMDELQKLQRVIPAKTA